MFSQFNEGKAAYNTDRNNFAPNVGFAWTLPASSGILGIAPRPRGRRQRHSCRLHAWLQPAGHVGLHRAIDDNPGISQTANRNHTLGNLGTPGSVLLRNPAELGPPAFAD